MARSLAALVLSEVEQPLGRDSCGMEQGLGWTQDVRSGVALPHGAAARRGAVEWSIFGGDVAVPSFSERLRGEHAARERRGVFRRRPGETPPDSRKKGDGDSVEAGGGSWAGAVIRSRERASGHGVVVTPQRAHVVRGKRSAGACRAFLSTARDSAY